MVGGADRGEGTGQREEDDLLVGPLLRSVVVDGDTARGDLRLLLGPGDVPGFVVSRLVDRWMVGGGRVVQGRYRETYEKTTSEGKESPALMPDIMIDVVVLDRAVEVVEVE